MLEFGMYEEVSGELTCGWLDSQKKVGLVSSRLVANKKKRGACERGDVIAATPPSSCHALHLVVMVDVSV